MSNSPFYFDAMRDARTSGDIEKMKVALMRAKQEMKVHQKFAKAVSDLESAIKSLEKGYKSHRRDNKK